MFLKGTVPPVPYSYAQPPVAPPAVAAASSSRVPVFREGQDNNNDEDEENYDNDDEGYQQSQESTSARVETYVRSFSPVFPFLFFCLNIVFIVLLSSVNATLITT